MGVRHLHDIKLPKTMVMKADIKIVVVEFRMFLEKQSMATASLSPRSWKSGRMQGNAHRARRR